MRKIDFENRLVPIIRLLLDQFVKYEFGSSRVLEKANITIELPEGVEIDLKSFFTHRNPFSTAEDVIHNNFSIELPTGIVEFKYNGKKG